MQKDITEKKNLIKRALAATMRECRGEQSLFKYSSENDIPLSIVSEAERGLKDPQLTTIFKMAEHIPYHQELLSTRLLPNYLQNSL